MNIQKDLWEKLAKENSRYYINSDKGRGITEAEFRQSGIDSYKHLVSDDPLLQGKESILDFGCGTGRLTEFMAKDYKKVVGVDISATMINEGKNRLKDLNNVDLIEIDGETVPLPDNTFDVVFSYLVFQHIKTREMVDNAIRDIYRVLKPGGIFKVLLRSDKQKDMNRWWSGVEFDLEAIKSIYTNVGFKLIKFEFQDKYAFWLWLSK